MILGDACKIQEHNELHTQDRPQRHRFFQQPSNDYYTGDDTAIEKESYTPVLKPAGASSTKENSFGDATCPQCLGRNVTLNGLANWCLIEPFEMILRCNR